MCEQMMMKMMVLVFLLQCGRHDGVGRPTDETGVLLCSVARALASQWHGEVSQFCLSLLHDAAAE